MELRVTYYALKPTQVGEEVRQVGDLIPEANSWPFIDGYVREGKLAPVLVATLPKKAQDELLRWCEDQELAQLMDQESANA